MWAAWNLCAKDTPILCEAHAYNMVGLFIRAKWWELEEGGMLLSMSSGGERKKAKTARELLLPVSLRKFTAVITWEQPAEAEVSRISKINLNGKQFCVSTYFLTRDW